MADVGVLSRERHQRFVERAVASGEVWVLVYADDPYVWATAELMLSARGRAGRPLPVVPVWSEASGAARCQTGAWEDYLPRRIMLPTFIHQALKNLDAQGTLVGTNWSAELVGGDVSALRLASELLTASTATVPLAR